MKSLSLAIGVTASLALCLCAPRNASAQEANGFGEKGELIISADRLMPFIGYSRESVDSTQGNVTTTQSESSSSISLLFGREAVAEGVNSHVDPHTIPRIAFDYVVIPHLTVGGAFVLGLGLGGSDTTTTTGNGPDTSSSTDAPTVTAVGLALRAGYVLPLGQSIAFWPRAGFAYYSLSAKTSDTKGNVTTETRETDTALSLDLDPQFVWIPIPHFFIHAGPLVNIPLAGKSSQTVDSGATSNENSADLHIFHIGLSAGLGGWFDL